MHKLTPTGQSTSRGALPAGHLESHVGSPGGTQAAASEGQLLPVDVVEGVERADAVRAALAELDADARQVLVNKYVDALSVAEIAERIGKSPKAVTSGWHSETMEALGA